MPLIVRLLHVLAVATLVVCAGCTGNNSGTMLPGTQKSADSRSNNAVTALAARSADLSPLITAAQSLGPTTVTQTTLFYDTFTSTSNWSPASGSWSLCKINVYCAAAGSANALSTAGSSTWTDYEIDSWLGVQAVNSVANYGAQVLARYQDSGNYYELELRQLNGKPLWEMFKVVNHVHALLASGSYVLPTNGYYHLRFVLLGSKLRAYATLVPNDLKKTSESLLGSATDSTFTHGSIGLQGLAGTAATFWQVGVYSVATVSPSPTPAPSGQILKLRINGTSQGSNYDYVKVAGKASLSGGLDLTFSNKPVSGQKYVLVTAARGISGTFSSIISHGVAVTSGTDATSFFVTVK